MKKILLTWVIAMGCFIVFGTSVSFTAQRLCYGEKTILESTSFSKDSILYFNWDLNGNQLYVDANGPKIKHQFSNPGTYNIGLQIITDAGDTFSMHRDIEIFDNPTAGFSTAINCSKDSTEFTNLSSIPKGVISNYIWNFGDGDATFLEQNPKHRYGKAGTFDVTVIAVSDQGCFDTLVKQVEIYKTPEFGFEYYEDTIFYEDDSVVISLDKPYPSISWSTGEKADSIIVKETKIIDVLVTDQNNCQNTNRIRTIAIPKKDLDPIDLVTPNNDGYNDVWFIKNTGGYLNIRVKVFNRYGDLVFEKDKYQNDWNGTYEGEPLPEGTYYYIIKILDNNKTYKGALSILR